MPARRSSAVAAARSSAVAAADPTPTLSRRHAAGAPSARGLLFTLLGEFVLPGGGAAAANCHMARSICRRAERRCWALSRAEPLGPQSLRYLNRLSDLLFVLARVLARRDVGSEVMWRSERARPDPPSGQ